MSDPTVLVVGLDAACFERLDPLLEDGGLPNLEALLESGVGASMETTTPPWTPSAWPSVVTGSRPWTHGAYDFHRYEGESAEHVSARDVRVPFLWEVLSACGHSSIVVNVPVTHPPHAFDGSLVPGYIAPETTDCLVDGDRVSMASLDDDYRIYPRGGVKGQARVDEYRQLIASRAAMATDLADRHPWSFMMVQFQSTDAVFHSMGDDESAIREVFESVDAAIGSLLDAAGSDAHVFVVSDHGMHRYERVFHCNTWLRDNGYLETTTSTSRRSWNERTRNELTDEDEETSLLSTATGTLLEGLGRVGVTPSRVERALGRVGLDERVARLFPESVLIDVVDAGEHVDWTASQAYCRSGSSLGIRCNVTGRDEGGVVPRSEFASLRAELVEELRALTDPEGRPVFERVYDRHRVHGSDVANEQSAPDVVVRPTDMVWEVSDIVRERTFAETHEFNHSYSGLLIADGEAIDAGAVDAEGSESGAVDGEGSLGPSVVDVAPTILSLFGIDPLETMDGRVLTELLADVPATESPPAVDDREFLGERRRDGVSEAVEDQLKEMGYVQ